MKEHKNKILEIGTKLYQYKTYIAEYEIIGVEKLKIDNKTTIFYKLKTLNCKDNCIIVAKVGDFGIISYSHYIGGDDFDEYDRNKGNMSYHIDQFNTKWFTKKEDARLYSIDILIKDYERHIKTWEKNIEEYTEKILSLKSEMELLNNSTRHLVENK